MGAISDIKNMMEPEQIEEQTIKDKFYYIPGPQNVAYMVTRAGVLLHKLAEGSLWQLGPWFLRITQRAVTNLQKVKEPAT